VIDLGVMVPAAKILDTAIEKKADMVGLSGLITPSLDEMVMVAREMERRKMTLPLLIGGATTSRQHTAVKIAPEFSKPVVHVLDASRVVDVVQSFMNPERRGAFERSNVEAQEEIRERYKTRSEKPLLSYEQARANKLVYDWDEHYTATPSFVGRRFLDDIPLEEIVNYIDWTYFFSAWELKGKFPAILDHPQYGEAARKLYEDAQALLKKIVNGKLIRARGVHAFWPAIADGDDIVVFKDENRREVLARMPMLRQQEQQPDDRPNLSLADYIAPKGSGIPDYIGMFAVTGGIGAEELSKRYQADHDDYNAIMVKALADRLAEAFATYLHARVRDDWGHPDAASLSPEDLHHEKHRGIRPAPGYPACPDHSGKFDLFALLQAERQGMALTDHAAMTPAATVSGFYFSHPQAKYFNVGRIGRDQVESYAKRKGVSIEEAQKWLGPNLAYESSEFAKTC
jgi:5-methyltetrahydrofolate--homocysteine methyltransferase